jgi:hypothetical protein
LKNKEGEKKMKKIIFQLIPLLVIIIATTGYSFDKKQERSTFDKKKERSDFGKKRERAVPAERCELCEPCNECCEPCNECNPCRACEICPPCEECKCCDEVPKTGEPCNCAYNAPARIDPACGWKTWLEVSFIYWQAKEKGLELGDRECTRTNEIRHSYSDTVNMDFDYLPGFKIGAGWSSCRDDWTLFVEYTRLEGNNCRSVNTSDDFVSFNSGWFHFPEGVPGLKAKWEIDYNIFDLELGRPYYVGRKLIFKPYFGLRAGWIDQEYNISAIFTDPTIDNRFHSEQDSWLIGPRAGIDTDWLFACHFRLFGNIAGSLNYQKFDTYFKHFSSNFESIVNEKDEISYLTPNAEFALGLGYGRYFCNSQWYFDLAVSYDFHYFWNQNMMRHLQDFTTFLIDGDAGNLMFHGLTITARLDF